MQTEKTDSWELYKRIFFSKRFTEALQEWKKRTGKNQEDFAEAIDGNRNSITKWKSGTDYPSQSNIRRICETLGVEDTYFSPQSHGELYQYSPEYQDGLSQELRGKASELGLNLDFLRALKGITPFDKNYPVFAPLGVKHTDLTSLESLPLDEQIKVVETLFDRERRPLAVSAPATDSLFQIEQEDGIHTLNCEDLRFLKQVQDKVSEYISFLFYQRERELMDEVTRENEQLHRNIGGKENG